jgi:hypothetical protein
MRIKSKFYRKFLYVLAALSMPLIVLDAIDFNNKILHLLHFFAFPILLAFGFVGAIVSIFHRLGKIEFIYSEDEKNKLHYLVASLMANLEHQQKIKYSEKYYRNYGLTNPNNSIQLGDAPETGSSE